MKKYGFGIISNFYFHTGQLAQFLSQRYDIPAKINGTVDHAILVYGSRYTDTDTLNHILCQIIFYHLAMYCGCDIL